MMLARRCVRRHVCSLCARISGLFACVFFALYISDKYLMLDSLYRQCILVESDYASCVMI